MLLDGDIDVELADYLRAVGFDVDFAPRDNPGVIEDDVQVLRYARRRRRILVCHDTHGDRVTQLRLFPEIYHRGGRILHITGDSSQPLFVALGKVLIQYENWSVWFRDNPNGGRVSVHTNRWVPTSAQEFMARHLRHVYSGEEIPPVPPRRRRQRRPSGSDVPPEQLPLR